MTSYVVKGLGLMIRKSGHTKKTRCFNHCRGSNPPAVPSLIWHVQGHVTPPTTQPRRAGISTVADMPQAAASLFGGRSNNLSKICGLVFGLFLDLVYMSQSRKNFQEVL